MAKATGYHAGELAAQARLGDTARAEHLGRSIRSTVPSVAAAFLAERQLLVVGAADETGRIWATVLTGEPGFVSVPDERTIVVAASPRPDDPLAGVLRGSAPASVGTVALEPATRRRMRVNGLAEAAGPSGLRLRTEQVFSNCPKYIQKRRPVRHTPTTAPGPARWSSALSAAQQAFVATADTFFLATADADGHVDASHRGGLPGFVELLSPTRLRWADYAGNGAYMTLGNLELNPRAGLVLPDWESGDTLLLTGEARTNWQERSVEFELTAAVLLPGALPMRWTEPEYSPANPPLR
ncbi:pyridoxamine 5'-phosphate oxidase family protein [Streptacidiphilus anmyonensis]|uniref:pyridoxamine 5'-phosphate oxidase family protein n=1 Tax=Streptacidiphilus anmyonensis TaxID=405782 RepID=UPI0005A9F124|nr:pyridoxamine 5'-phosphate oxidase family protein [Streptacidiphilus anmyonensis]